MTTTNKSAAFKAAHKYAKYQINSGANAIFKMTYRELFSKGLKNYYHKAALQKKVDAMPSTVQSYEDVMFSMALAYVD